jgi:hypothetical protein
MPAHEHPVRKTVDLAGGWALTELDRGETLRDLRSALT